MFPNNEPYGKPDVKDILRKYGRKIENRINSSDINIKESYSREYLKFKEEMAPELTKYERWCKSLGSLIKLNISDKDKDKIKKNLEIAHLDIEPWQAVTFSVMSFVGVFFVGLLISISVVLIKGSLAAFPLLFFFLIFIFALFLFYFVNGYPSRLANQWRLKASSQMVPAILYIVVYMRHTPNLERAVAFASQHLQQPLSLDFKKIFYDVEVGKFSTIKESLDNYLQIWKVDSSEFIEAFHLIESSLFEPDNTKRISTLEKSLQVILDGVYDKMLKFTHNVRSPLTNVYMLGVVLPTLGLALLPLASAMIGDILKWYHVIILFNLIIPFFVFYLTDKIMMQRPGGYGETDLLERNPLYFKYKSKKPYVNASLILVLFLMIGFIPLIFQYTPVPELLGIGKDISFAQIGFGIFGDEKIFGFIQEGNKFVGPFGVGALVLSMFIPLGIALFFSMVYFGRTKELIVEREKTRRLEKEFNNSLFQLGNRIGNGVPPELAFGIVAESSRSLVTEDFFRRVNYNIRRNGMSVERAIFDPVRGAINYYPSDLIATSMRVLIESSKKGLKIAAVSLMSISEYVKNIQKISNRLRDMLAEIISDMKSNMTFLAPLLSGIVVGLAAMITSILSRLNVSGLGDAGAGNFQTLLTIFDISKMIPPYYLQIAIGIYLIQIIFILTKTLVVIDSGEDKLQRINSIGKNLRRGITLYFITGLLAILALFALSSVVIGGVG
ncbi:MAG: hypothetical protein IIA85_03205 [Nanoarchaeota archaeon]|nr:hypothetical protein [Nanoarchaeota archaeon]